MHIKQMFTDVKELTIVTVFINSITVDTTVQQDYTNGGAVISCSKMQSCLLLWSGVTDMCSSQKLLIQIVKSL
jgi:hypothetical protein